MRESEKSAPLAVPAGGGPEPKAPGQLHIGVRLRQARKARRLRLWELADRVGCSESLISKIENDRITPSLQMLHKIVTELGTSIGALFSESGSDGNFVSREGSRPIVSVDAIGLQDGRGIRLECLVQNGQLLYGSIHIVDPGGDSGGSIAHVGEEVGYVLDGDVEMTIGDRSYRLKAGDSFFFPSETPHSYRNPGSSVARILWVNTPSTF